MSKQIFQTDRCVLMAYPPGASGNFLINCLCFHSQFRPRSRRIFKDTEHKISLIQAQLDYQTSNGREDWRDFNMDDLHFYNVNDLWYAHVPHTPIETLPDQHLEHHQQYFFKIVHWNMELDACRRVWPRAQVILLVNTDDYIDARYKDSAQPRVVTDIAEARDSVNPGLRWDCSWFLSWDEFIMAYTRLLAEFGLEPENVEKLQHFYQVYIRYWFPDLAS